jgi:hypothetical protein
MGGDETVDFTESRARRPLCQPVPTLTVSVDATQYDPDPAKASRIDVTFEAEGQRTKVELVHSDLDRHGEGWERVRDSVSAPGGWGTILDGFAARTTAE